MSRATDLTIERYFTESAKTDRFTKGSLDERSKRLGFGFFGEIGGLLSALKKNSRDQLQPSAKSAATEELGDALWYLARLARLSGSTSARVAAGAHHAMRARNGEGPRNTPKMLTFDSLDSLANYYRNTVVLLEGPLLRSLAADSGKLIAMSHADVAVMDLEERGALFGGLLATMTVVAVHFRLKMSTIALENLAKTQDRWSVGVPRYVVPATAGREWEQFPTKFSVEFTQRSIASKVVVVQQIGGLNIGDPLTDNSHVPDGYRFHDIFHLAYLAHLGWSPVIRALLKLKRKSVSRIDENDDGARAIIIEEGIATWIFNHAQAGPSKNYETVEVGRLQYDILKQVREMVSRFEVAKTPLWQWEIAILDGFAVFRQLLKNKGGTVHVDLMKHTLSYESPPTTKALK